MKSTTDHPGVYVPPPLFYISIFVFSMFLQKQFPLPYLFFETNTALIAGLALVLLGLTVVLPALVRFVKTRNTLITVKPANSLQTSGIYSISRNPMYLGLLTLYVGIGFLEGNFWTLILVPVVVGVITYFVILNEEKYLSRAFGNDYDEYRKRVRRWI